MVARGASLIERPRARKRTAAAGQRGRRAAGRSFRCVQADWAPALSGVTVEAPSADSPASLPRCPAALPPFPLPPRTYPPVFQLSTARQCPVSGHAQGGRAVAGPIPRAGWCIGQRSQKALQRSMLQIMRAIAHNTRKRANTHMRTSGQIGVFPDRSWHENVRLSRC